LYLIYGREEPIPEEYTLSEYEREPPSDLSPGEAGYLLKSISVVNVADLMAGEVLWLVKNGYLKMEEIEIGKKKVVCFQKTEKQPKGIKSHQRRIYDYIVENPNIEYNSQKYFTFEAIKERDLDLAYTVRVLLGCLENFFSRGNYIDNTANNTMILLSAVFMLSVYFIDVFGDIVLLGLVEAFCFVILVSRRKDILGRWSKEGRIEFIRWSKYKKFMEDLTLMKEKLPEDIILWETLLVYATAFGVAEKVIKAMKITVPEEKIKRSSLRVFTTSAPIFITSLGSSIMIAAPSGGGGGISGISGGGFGGGFGGGGGGGGAR
jgi:uncharacterized membrane protein